MLKSFGRRLLGAYLIGVCLALIGVGVWGLYSDVVFGFLPTNRSHALGLNVVPGCCGLVAAVVGYARPFLKVLVAGLCAAVAMFLLPWTNGWWTTTFNMNSMSALTEFALAVVTLGVLTQIEDDAFPSVLSSLTGKTVVVTGATSGIGRAVAERLAPLGGHVVLVARNEERLAEVASELAAANPDIQVTTKPCDLSSVAEVAQLAESLAEGPPIDVLINNAGAYFATRGETDEGWERTWALNHLAYAGLTLRLWPHLPKGARVINVASESHRMAELDLSDVCYRSRAYSPVPSYTASKLANLLFTYELHRRGWERGITVNAMCPGTVRSNFAQSDGGWLQAVYRLTGLFMRTPFEAARIAVHLAASERVAGHSGQYFQGWNSGRSSSASYSGEAASRLWRLTLEQLEVDDPCPAPVEPQVRDVRVGDATVHVREIGEGPPVVLLHGYPQSGAMWRRHFRWLSQRHRVIAPDWLGWGKSERDQRHDVTYEAEIERVGAFLDAVGVDRCRLILHDYAGLIGLPFAARNPERIETLAILNSRAHRTFPGLTYALTTVTCTMARVPGLSWLLAALPLHGIHRIGLKRDQALAASSNEVVASYVDWLRSSRGRRYWTHFMARYRVAPTLAVLKELEQLDIPAVVVWGDADPWCPISVAEELAEALPGGSLGRVDGGGHFIAEERPWQVKLHLEAVVSDSSAELSLR